MARGQVAKPVMAQPTAKVEEVAKTEEFVKTETTGNMDASVQVAKRHPSEVRAAIADAMINLQKAIHAHGEEHTVWLQLMKSMEFASNRLAELAARK